MGNRATLPDLRPGVNGVTAAAKVVVQVKDQITSALTGHDGCSYQSPPQTRDQAMALVRMLLGHAVDQDGERQWTAPIAGGRRVVTLTEEAEW